MAKHDDECPANLGDEVFVTGNLCCTNTIGETEILTHDGVRCRITKAWLDYETGWRFHGEVLDEAAIENIRAQATTEFNLEWYRLNRPSDVLGLFRVEKAIQEFNPAKVFFGERDIAPTPSIRRGHEMADYSKDQLETCLCVWEAILAMRNGADKAGLPDGLQKKFERHGASGIRIELVPSVAAWVDKVYPLISSEARDLNAFDWDIVPAIMDEIDWSSSDFPSDHASVAERVSAKLMSANTVSASP